MIRNLVGFLAIFVLTIGAVACGGDAAKDGGGCSADADCKGDRICVDGSCVDPGGGNNTTSNNQTNENNSSQSSNNTSSDTDGNDSSSGAACSDVCAHIDSVCMLGGNVGTCEANCESALTTDQRDCVLAASTCQEADACADSGGNNTDSNNTSSNNQSSGELGDTCDDNDQCDSAFCKIPAGASEGQCAVNDFGDTCEFNSDCEYNACLFDNSGDTFGYCTHQCESFTDCPTFWDCEEVGNAGGTYCVQD